MYQHILICTDGSEFARKGVDHGLALAQAFGAKVTIVVVSETILPHVGEGEVGAFAYQDYTAMQKAAAERVLATVEQEALGRGLKVDTVWQEMGSPAEAIVETAKTSGCDLIVMSSHGRRGLRRLLLGSVTSEVLVLSPVPVLVVR